MKVGQNTNIEISKLQQNMAQQAQPSQSKQTGTAAEVMQHSTRNAQAGVPVTVSNSARSLDQTAKSSAKSSSDVDMAKVQAMRDAIANGTFRINASAIADKLLTDAGQLLDTPVHS